MRSSTLIVALALVAGIASWLLDALVHVFVLDDGDFLSRLILDVPPTQLYHRLLVFALFVGFGLVVASIQAARERGRRFHRAVVEAMADGLVSFADDGRVQWANDAFRRMVGDEGRDLMGTHLTDLVTEASREVVHDMLCDDVGESGGEREVAFVRAGEEEVPALIRQITPQVTGSLSDRRFFVVADITDRKSAAESERRSAAMLRELLNASPDAAGLLELDGTVIGANDRLADLLETTVEELEGGIIFDYLSEEEIEVLRPPLEEAARTRQMVQFEDHRRGIWLEHRGCPIFDEHSGVTAVAVFARDVTERRRAEQKLRESEERYRTLFETTGTAMCMVEDDGTLVLVNDRFSEATGYAREQVEGRMRFTDLIPPHEQECMSRYHIERREGGEPPAEYEFDFIHRDGEVRRALLAVNLIPGTRTSVASLIDITERREAQRKLEQQARIIEQAHDIILITDLEGNIVDANRAEVEALGIPREELLQMTIFDLSDRPWEQQEVLEHTLTHGEWYGEVVNCTSDGGERVLEVRTFVFEDEEGNPEWLVGISRDITLRREAEQQVERALAERQMIMDAMSEVVTMLDLDYHVLVLNRAAARSVGLEAEEIIGRPCYEIWGQSHERCATCPVAETMRTGERSTGEKVTPDGRTWDISADPVFEDGELVGVVEVARDITERRKREEEVNQLNQFRRSVIDQANIWVQVIDLEDRVLLWNPAAEEMSGYSAEEVVGESDVWEHLYPDPNYRSEVGAVRQEIMEEGQVVDNLETVIQTRDGSERIISWNSRRLLDPSGEPIGAIAVGRDVTRAHELEEQLRQAAKMEAVGRLAGGIAHDFNNMLTAILGNAQLLSLRHHDDEDRDLVEEIRIAAGRSADLVGQLLAFSRKQVLAPEVLDLNEIVLDMEPMLNRMIGENVSLLANLDPNLGPISADASQMQQVLMNLVVNARDAMPDGGTISIDTSTIHLDENYATTHAGVQPGVYAMLAVSDTGIGMDGETQSRIFEPFFTTKGEQEGTGLGLATVYGIVSQSGGQIMVYSEPQRGTTFKVYMPLIEGKMPLEAGADGEPVSAVGGATILVVEDEETVRRMLVRTLERQRHKVLDAESGEEALELTAEHDGPIDLMVTDVVMPGMTGVELAERISRQRPDIRVLFLSGYTDSAIVQNGMVSTEENYLQKPFAAEELLRILRGLLREDD